MLVLGGVFLIVLCIADALPVPSLISTGDEWNLLVLGLFIVIGMGAVLVACVRCRRKKRGFEEFKNEATKATRTATTVEAIRTEFPIFQALSTPSSPQFQQLDNESSKDSRDDLHADQIDILDEVAAAATNRRASFSQTVVNRRSVEHENYLEKAPDTQYAELSEDTIILTFHPPNELIEEPFVHHTHQNSATMEANNCQSAKIIPKGDGAAQEEDGEGEEEVANTTEGLIDNEKTVPSDDPEYESSVEEALRELDIAIGHNDGQLDDDDDDDDDDEESESAGDCDVAETRRRAEGDNEDDHFENVLRQLFIDNMLSSLSSVGSSEGAAVEQQPKPEQQSITNLEGSNEVIDQSDEKTIGERKNEIPDMKATAEVTDEVMVEVMHIVDSLITECCAQQEEGDNATVVWDKGSSVASVLDQGIRQDIKPVLMAAVNHSGLHSEVDDPEEGFFDHLPAICQSTPSVQHKRVSQVEAQDFDGAARHALFGDETITVRPDAGEESVVQGTFILAQEDTFSVVAKSNGKCIPAVNVEHDIDATFDKGSGRPAQKGDHDNYLKDNNATITPVNTPIEINYDYKEKQELGVHHVAETTFTKEPRSEGVPLTDLDKPSTSKGSGGWFLHAPQDMQAMGEETFDFDSFPPPPPPQDLELADYDYDYMYEEEEDDDEDGDRHKNMDLTFDALRKQLTDLLPHAQGAPALDDEGAVGGSCESGMSASLLEAMLNNIDPSPAPAPEANFKRPLSPIMEESEEENTTIKTSILNDTKNLDSTSTGCIETLSEAVMGVTRTLMASNDTLFNFEDTLGDREDLTPTPLTSGFASAASPINTVTAAGPGILNETYPMEQQKPAASDEKHKASYTMTLDLTAVRADIYSNALDVTSPEQLKTFSEDIDVDHVSGSDASGNMDPDGTYTTNTIEMETCISLNKDEEAEECDRVEDLEKDERISEDSEELEASSSANSNLVNRVNSVEGGDNADAPVEVVKLVGALSEVRLENGEDSGSENKENGEDSGGENKENEIIIPLSNAHPDPLEQTKLFLAREIDYSQGWHKVSTKCVDATVFHVQAVVNPPKLELDLVKRSSASETLSPLLEDERNNNLTLDLNENVHRNGLDDSATTVDCAEKGDDDGDDQKDHHLSGEEDPWAGEAQRYSGNESHEAEMLTVFNSDWDKESAEDSDNNGDMTDEGDGDSIDSDEDSSEEFMYVQGSNIQSKAGNAAADTNGAAVWEAHVDQVPIGKRIIEESKFETVEEEEGVSDGDGEFIPSCWNSTAKPSRSALKSPDKSSSDEESNDGKRRPRNVAFKKQHYHSVYEYPKEINPLSPSLSEPTFSINFRDHSPGNPSAAVGDIDGFMISSSTRPFHNNQFLAQCNTWPSENDFSWSQHMPDDGGGSKMSEGTVVYSEIPIEWPRKVIVDGDADDSEGSEANPVPCRPDSGVGESLGELRHTKGLLRLPLMPPPAITLPPLSALLHAKDDSDEELRKETSDEGHVLPTPSCTGSMDSLSSSSCSDRQISFTTFGKVTPQSSLDDTSRFSQHSGTGSTEIKLTFANGPGDSAVEEGEEEEEEEEERGEVVDLDENAIKFGENTRSRVSDSTDEDSGIENISRKIK